jgi:hypothetical protein
MVIRAMLTLAIIVCLIITACAAAWTAFMLIVWNPVVAPIATCCTNIAKAWIDMVSDPAKYQLHGPYDSLDLLCHPYFHHSLDLTVLERYIMVISKYAGLFAVLSIPSILPLP